MENLHRFESECAPAASPRGANWSGKRRRAGPLAAVFAVAVLLSTGASFAGGGHQHLGGLDSDGKHLMGVSGGNINHFDADDITCHNGTLGALLQDNATTPKTYILSNNHVLARINAPPGSGEIIVQPGLVDSLDGSGNACFVDANNAVATLSAREPVIFDCVSFAGKRLYECFLSNVVDAAIAEVFAGTASQKIMDLGDDGGGGNVCPEFYLSTYSLEENSEVTIGMPVCKSGRTTGLTCSKVRSIDVVAAIQYCADCDPPLVASFHDQIMVKGGDFAGPGDSGSFIVNSLDRKAVALVFAFSSRGIIANPIDAVLERLSFQLGSSLTILTIVGDEGVCGEPIAQADGGGGKGNKGKGPGSNKSAGAGMAIGLEVARDVKRRHEDKLFGFPGVVGTGIGADKAGNPVIEVYLGVGGSVGFGGPQLPDELEGVPVRPVVTGPFIAY